MYTGRNIVIVEYHYNKNFLKSSLVRAFFSLEVELADSVVAVVDDELVALLDEGALFVLTGFGGTALGLNMAGFFCERSSCVKDCLSLPPDR